MPISFAAAHNVAHGEVASRLSGLARVDQIERMHIPADATARPPTQASSDNDILLTANETIYFVLGSRGGVTALFQFGFKYRMFDSNSIQAELFPLLSRLHFGYTRGYGGQTKTVPRRQLPVQPILAGTNRFTGTGFPAHRRLPALSCRSNGTAKACSTTSLRGVHKIRFGFSIVRKGQRAKTRNSCSITLPSAKLVFGS